MSTVEVAPMGPVVTQAAGLEVEELSVRFRLGRDVEVRAVTDASFALRAGECLALVGESGCGKSVMAHALLGLLPPNAEVAGTAWLRHRDGTSTELLTAPEALLARWVRGREVGLVPQSPAAHLTPVRTARAQLEEAVRELDGPVPALDLAERVGLVPRDLDRFPHELSGGLAQRVANAIALAGDPWLLVADEPTTGLDPDLVGRTMAELRRRCDEGRAVLLITHDLGAAETVADRVAVMYASRLVEVAPTPSLFSEPHHPYSRGLLDSLPSRAFVPIPGLPPELTRLPAGCPFAPRCDRRTAECQVMPALVQVGTARTACHHPIASWPHAAG